MIEHKQAQEDFVKICTEKKFRWGLLHDDFAPAITSAPKMMREICRNRFGNDENSIQRHSQRHFLTECGVIITLDRNLSFEEPVFMALLQKVDYEGIVPVLPINGSNGWGQGCLWETAEHLLCEALGIELVRDAKMYHAWGGNKKDDEIIQEWCDVQVNT